MLDQFGWAGAEETSTQFFYASTDVLNQPHWQAWEKPRGARMVSIFIVGAGAGGGGGATGAAGTVRGGGGGGGSGAIVRWTGTSDLLPDVLYIQVGRHGAGGAVGATGTNGGRTFVAFSPVSNSPGGNTFMVSGAANAIGGVGGTTAAGTGGAASTVAAQTSALFVSLGLFVAIVGQAGSAAGAVGGAAGVAVAPLTASLTSGGAGGGTTPASNANYAGGAQTALGPIMQRNGGTAGTGLQGDHGVSVPRPWCSCGGAGGGTNGAAGTGGAGANGGIGSGGGGGGGGVTGGVGGNGGNGLCVITAW